jgi:hypothetical protein
MKKLAVLSLSMMSFGIALGTATPSHAELSVNQEIMLCISKATTPADKQACIDFWKAKVPTQTAPGAQGQTDLKAAHAPAQPSLRSRR